MKSNNIKIVTFLITFPAVICYLFFYALNNNHANGQWHYSEEMESTEITKQIERKNANDLDAARKNAPIRQANATEALVEEIKHIREELRLIRTELMQSKSGSKHEPAARLFIPEKSMDREARAQWRDI